MKPTRNGVRTLGGVGLAVVVGWTLFVVYSVYGVSGPIAVTALAQARPAVTKDTVDQWMTELSNWGRWGQDDQRGTLNLITPEKRKRAAALVQAGVSVSLSHTYLEKRSEDATSPFGHEMLRLGVPGSFVSDRFTIAYHGYAHSHMDSLCHMSHEGKGKMYNGFLPTEINEDGCAKFAVTNFKQGIVTRGVLMDIARLKGVEYLEPGTPIYPADLDAWEQQAGITVESGDIVFVRNGRWARRAASAPGRPAGGLQGCTRRSCRGSRPGTWR